MAVTHRPQDWIKASGHVAPSRREKDTLADQCAVDYRFVDYWFKERQKQVRKGHRPTSAKVG